MWTCAGIAALATLQIDWWLATSLRFLWPYKWMVLRTEYVAILAFEAAVFVSLWGGLYAVAGDIDRRRTAQRLAKLNDDFKAGKLPLKRES